MWRCGVRFPQIETAYGGCQKDYKKTEKNTKFNELCTSLEAIKLELLQMFLYL